jgi:hypothetical protein
MSNVLEVSSCLFCGKEYVRSPSHVNQKFCGPNCRYKTWRREHNAEARALGRAHNTRWKMENPDKSKMAEWRSKGIVDLENALNLWKGPRKCYICGKTEGRFCVDHDHKNGLTRGLLCDDCNLGLGNFYDNMDILLKAVAYIEFWRNQ